MATAQLAILVRFATAQRKPKPPTGSRSPVPLIISDGIDLKNTVLVWRGFFIGGVQVKRADVGASYDTHAARRGVTCVPV